jgi:hypothetical protein
MFSIAHAQSSLVVHEKMNAPAIAEHPRNSHRAVRGHSEMARM